MTNYRRCLYAKPSPNLRETNASDFIHNHRLAYRKRVRGKGWKEAHAAFIFLLLRLYLYTKFSKIIPCDIVRLLGSWY
jgi:hypothetical protein